MVLEALVISSVISFAFAYNIAYYDCGDITGLTTYQINMPNGSTTKRKRKPTVFFKGEKGIG